jgi:hypothetical protein
MSLSDLTDFSFDTHSLFYVSVIVNVILIMIPACLFVGAQAWLQAVGQELGSGVGDGEGDMMSSMMALGPGGMGGGVGSIGMNGMGFDEYQDRDNMIVSARAGLSEDKVREHYREKRRTSISCTMQQFRVAKSIEVSLGTE